MKNVCKKIMLIFACLAMVSCEYTACFGDIGALYDPCKTSTAIPYFYNGVEIVNFAENTWALSSQKCLLGDTEVLYDPCKTSTAVFYTYDGIAAVPATEMQPFDYSLYDHCCDCALTEQAVEQERFMPTWQMKTSLNMAPSLFKGIFSYYQSLCHCPLIPSFHRLILVGPPGSGKTTLAYAAAQQLDWDVKYISASDLLGKHRNYTAANIRDYFKQLVSKNEPTIVIFDELHKLFELHDSELSDDSHNAAAFWLSLDELEKTNPYIIVIGTANSVAKLPPEIKSRFHGKIITMKAPNKKNKLKALINIVENDDWIKIDDDLITDKAFIVDLLAQHENFSLRDIKLLVDTAKMFRFAQTGCFQEYTRIILGKKHFRQAMKQLKKETQESKKSLVDIVYPIVQKWGLFVATTINVITLCKIFKGDTHNSRSPVS